MEAVEGRPVRRGRDFIPYGPKPQPHFVSAALDSATEHQARPRVALSAALASGPSHAYLFRGPRGSGKRAAARAFAAEILAAAAADPDDARRRALLDPSPHPDLVWLAPRGAQHLVEEVRERVIRAAAYRPFEGGKRVFVVEAAEAMRDESQNALLKTLEEPPDFVHLILLSSEPEALLETVASRCQPIDFAPLPAAVLEAELAADGTISGDGRQIGPSAGGGDRGGGTARRRRPRARSAAAQRARSRASRRGRALRHRRARRDGRRGALAAAARPRRGGRLRHRSGDPGGARGGVLGRPQAHRPRDRRGVQTRRPPPPHRDPRPRLRALRGLAARPRRPRQRRRGGRRSTATASPSCAPRRPASIPTAPAAAPRSSRRPAAASISTSPRSWRLKRCFFASSGRSQTPLPASSVAEVALLLRLPASLSDDSEPRLGVLPPGLVPAPGG